MRKTQLAIGFLLFSLLASCSDSEADGPGADNGQDQEAQDTGGSDAASDAGSTDGDDDTVPADGGVDEDAGMDTGMDPVADPDLSDTGDSSDPAADPPRDPTADVDLGPDADGDDGGPGPYPQPTATGWVIDVDDSFWQSMDDLIFDVLAGTGVQLYLAVLDANHFNREPYRAQGMELIRHPDSFIENALVPLLERYGDSGAIWAIDCLNEPEALITGSTGNWAGWGVSWAEMQDYLVACADAVYFNSSLMVSAGSGWHYGDNIEQGRYDGLGFDFLDYHYYADAPDIATVAELDTTYDVVIGECGQLASTWDDALQLEATRECFAQAESGGYLAALSWYYNHAGSTNHHSHLESDGTWRPVEAAFSDYADSSLEVGINLAWLSGAYDHDMALNPIHPTWGVAYDHDVAAAVIQDLEDHEIPILRFWVFEGGEGLYVHDLFEDFEGGRGRWAAAGEGITLRSSTVNASDGSYSIAIEFDPETTGWHGTAATWPAETPLNLAIAREWRQYVYNDLNRAVGVNLAFVVETDSGPITYQTRSGAGGGQLWLEPGASGTQAVSLTAADFPSKWALASSSDVGATRPSDALMQKISRIDVRVHVSEGQLPLSGDLFLDGVRIW